MGKNHPQNMDPKTKKVRRMKTPNEQLLPETNLHVPTPEIHSKIVSYQLIRYPQHTSNRTPGYPFSENVDLQMQKSTFVKESAKKVKRI